MTETIIIARDGAELGNWSPEDVRRMLASGVLTVSDYFFAEGMTTWATMDQFTVVPTAPKSYSITFGSGKSVDKLGFVRSGQLLTSNDAVEITGPKLWPAIARVGCFIVATPILWVLLGAITAAVPEAGALFAVIQTGLWLFTVIGAPLIALMLIRSFCASPGSVTLLKGDITDVLRSGKQISFKAKLKTEGLRRALFRAADETAAAQIEASLCS